MSEFEYRRKLWTDALRSGTYTQAHCQLYDGSGFCCLGVACEIYRQETGIGEWTTDNEFKINHSYAAGSLPTDVKEWFGFAGDSGEFIRPEISLLPNTDDSLASLNDDGDFSFVEIADFVETNPEGLWITK